MTHYIAFVIRWVHKHRINLAGLATVWLLTILLALVWPLADQETIAAGDRNMLATGGGSPKIAPAEDLAAFVQSGRWGTSLQEVMKLNDAMQSSALNPVLLEMGYVGFIASGSQREVLLILPDGTTSRVKVGDKLADRRILKDIKENSITLMDAQQKMEILLLFPEIREINRGLMPDFEVKEPTRKNQEKFSKANES